MGTCFQKYIAILHLTLLGVVGSVPSLFAETEIEAKLKAGFVVNFARFTSWPPESFTNNSSSLSICTVGVKGARESFAGIEDKKIKGRPVALKILASLDEVVASGCQLAFVKEVSKEELTTYLKEHGSAPIVTVSEVDGFSRLGGTIEFVKNKNRLSFRINNTDAKQRQLKIDASLLNLALEVL